MPFLQHEPRNVAERFIALSPKVCTTAFLRAIDPATADFEHVHDPAQNSPIILALRPRLDLGQMRLDLRPLVIVKPKQMRVHRLASESID